MPPRLTTALVLCWVSSCANQGCPGNASAAMVPAKSPSAVGRQAEGQSITRLVSRTLSGPHQDSFSPGDGRAIGLD